MGKARQQASGRGGFTLVEVSMALAVFLLGVLGFTSAMVSIERSQLAQRESSRAMQAARTVLERIQAEAFPEAFRRYNGDPSDDPGGAGTAPGEDFDVPGLSARPGDSDGRAGEVRFPTPAGQPGLLLESHVDPRWEMPRDLNGDGAISSSDNQATQYRLLPVRVVVEWTSPAGTGRVQLDTMLGNF